MPMVYTFYSYLCIVPFPTSNVEKDEHTPKILMKTNGLCPCECCANFLWHMPYSQEYGIGKAIG